MLPREVVYTALIPLREAPLSQGPYMKQNYTTSRDTRQPDQMESTNCAILASLLIALSPPLDLRTSTAYLTQSATNNKPRINSVLTRPKAELRDLPTHSGPLGGPAIVKTFLQRRPLRDFELHEREEPDWAYQRQRAAEEIADMRNCSELFNVEAYLTEPFGQWLYER